MYPTRSQCANQRSARRRSKPPESAIDHREQLYNDGLTGPIEEVQLPEAMIVSQRGILLDLDPKWFRQGSLPKGARSDPDKFYKKFASKMLGRHPVLARAEVRMSGQGLHVIIRLSPPLQYESDSDRQRWAGIAKAIQRVLPTDPDCPGITALTRPIGSINAKNGAEVRGLHVGEAVTVEEVLGLFDKIRTRPFQTVAKILFGDDRISPCPICKGPGSRLDVLYRTGKCYGRCGKVRLAQLFDVFLKPRPASKGA